jgi:hypothetical protein
MVDMASIGMCDERGNGEASRTARLDFWMPVAMIGVGVGPALILLANSEIVGILPPITLLESPEIRMPLPSKTLVRDIENGPGQIRQQHLFRTYPHIAWSR